MTPKTDPSHLIHLLDRQANLWEIRRKLAQEGGEAARRELAHLREGPWLTISKQAGSGGVELAHNVARELGWQVYDREILEGIARNTDAREAVLARLDEKDMGWLEDCVRRLMSPEDPSRGSYLAELGRVIYSLGRQGRAVLLGRGANWLLTPEFGLRVRAIAPLEMRAERVSRDKGLDPAAAKVFIQEDDRNLGKFIRHAYGHDIDDPQGYDLVLNLGAMSPGAATATVVGALRGKLGG